MTPFWDDRVARWVADRIGVSDFGECRALGVANNQGELIAGTVFHNWNPDAGVIEISGAATDRRWMTRSVLRVIFGYAFSSCQAVIARHAESNEPARRLWVAFGATEHEIPHVRGRDQSEIVAVLTSDAWAQSKYMRCQDGQG